MVAGSSVLKVKRVAFSTWMKIQMKLLLCSAPFSCSRIGRSTFRLYHLLWSIDSVGKQVASCDWVRPALLQQVPLYFSMFLQKSEAAQHAQFTQNLWMTDCLLDSCIVGKADFKKQSCSKASNFFLFNASKGKAAVNERCVQEAREAWLSDEDESHWVTQPEARRRGEVERGGDVADV